MQNEYEESDDEDEMPQKPEEKTPEQEAEEKALFMCSMCKQMFREKGMCPNCEVVLKKRGG